MLVGLTLEQKLFYKIISPKQIRSLLDLIHKCLSIPVEIVLWVYYTFDNTFGTKIILQDYFTHTN